MNKQYTTIKPNIRFEIRALTAKNDTLAQLNIGNIPQYNEMSWSKYGLSDKYQ